MTDHDKELDALVALLFLTWKGAGSSTERKQRTRDLVGEYVDGKVQEVDETWHEAMSNIAVRHEKMRVKAVQEERERIVRWLRERAENYLSDSNNDIRTHGSIVNGLADRLERGEEG